MMPDGPSFDELRDAMMPPGADKDALWSALKGAHQTGGHVPGRPAPDISGTLDPAVAKVLGVPEAGGRPFRLLPCMVCRTFHESSEPCAEVPSAGHGSASPADPFPPGAAPAAALHEMFTDFLAAGFTEDQATAILGKMLAAYGREP